jgi:uncharacterized glyoxalase superfamily protein PhnB
MADDAVKTGAPIIPCLRYRDAMVAIDWLCRAFGFHKQVVVPGPNGTVAHAQLTFGTGMVMVGSIQNTEFGRWIAQPDENGDRETQAPYVVVKDVDTHYARAMAAGARVVTELKNQSYGGRDYSCRDPEGHLWSFGTFDPWKA